LKLKLFTTCTVNLVAMLGLAREGAKRGTGTCDSRDHQLSGSHVRRVLKKHNIRTPTLKSPARPVQYVFFAIEYSQILSRQGSGGGVCEMFLARGSTDGSAVGRGCWSWRRAAGNQRKGKALASSRPTLRDSSLLAGNEARSYARRRRVAAGGTTRCGGGGPQDRPPPGKPDTEGFRINNFRTHKFLRSGDSISEFVQPLPQSVPNYRQAAYGGVPRAIGNGFLPIKAPPCQRKTLGKGTGGFRTIR
jgi:hypothetical protein